MNNKNILTLYWGRHPLLNVMPACELYLFVFLGYRMRQSSSNFFEHYMEDITNWLL